MNAAIKVRRIIVPSMLYISDGILRKKSFRFPGDFFPDEETGSALLFVEIYPFPKAILDVAGLDNLVVDEPLLTDTDEDRRCTRTMFKNLR
mmetsp:Transcript_12068/g.18520  ORF Transcript_12068/g.18520 Transcript_12068/m.18520 type:complete len:91 (-) Transcript_12068:147-419(-)